MSIKLEGNLYEAIRIVDRYVYKGVMENLILEITKPMDYTNVGDTRIIVDLMNEPRFKFDVIVKLWRPWNRWSKALAMTKPNEFGVIYINSRRLNRSVASIAGTIAHEWAHILEFKVRKIHPTMYFNHGDNSPVGKANTFQYIIGNKMKKLLDPAK